MGAGHGHKLHYHGHSFIHRAPAHLKLVSLLGFMLVVVATPRDWHPAFAVYAVVLLAVVGASRVPPIYLAKRMAIEIPFVVFAVLVPFVAQGPQVEVLGLDLSEPGLVAAGGLLMKGTLGVLASLSEPVARYSSAFGHLLGAADMAVHGAVEVALAGDPASDDFRTLADAVGAEYVPSLVIAGGASRAGGPTDVALLADKVARDGRATAYVCRQYLCEEPTTDASALPAQLERAARSPLGVGA